MQLKHTGRNAHALYEGPGMGVPAQVTVLSGQTWGALHLTWALGTLPLRGSHLGAGFKSYKYLSF